MEMHAPCRRPAVIGGINGITEDWTTERRQMGPELVGAARERLQPDPLCRWIPPGQTPTGAASTAIRMGPITGRVTLQAGEGYVDATAKARERRADIGAIKLVHPAGSKQGAESPQGLRRTGQKQHT